MRSRAQDTYIGLVPSSATVILRIKGGVGNQMFSYAMARRLSSASGADLAIDSVTGFTRDFTYRRSYELDRLPIRARSATRRERLQPFGSLRHRVRRLRGSRLPLAQRSYLFQDDHDFDPRILDLRVDGSLHLEGYWQSERYFTDVADEIRRELTPPRPSGARVQALGDEMREADSVAIHVRWFTSAGSDDRVRIGDLSAQYYEQALEGVAGRVSHPRFFLFSDDLRSARPLVERLAGPVTPVDSGDAVDDMWLMSQCRHVITANSTFSWWGAWLAEREGSVIMVPEWGPVGLIPPRWEKVVV